VVVVCPGGGYAGLAEHEGPRYARYLVGLGVAAFVLKYRLGSAGYRHPTMMRDVQRAVRTVRARAAQWGLDPTRLGVMGSSAGGHLASVALTLFDDGAAASADPIERASCRPDFGVLCYPVIAMEGPYAHAGSRENLLGPAPDRAALALLSTERQVTARTPPCFLWHLADDEAVPPENSLHFAAALRRCRVPFELHVYPRGGHGVGLGGGGSGALLPWTRELSRWLRELGVAPA
jgi:acetyl esterase/lipase